MRSLLMVVAFAFVLIQSCIALKEDECEGKFFYGGGMPIG